MTQEFYRRLITTGIAIFLLLFGGSLAWSSPTNLILVLKDHRFQMPTATTVDKQPLTITVPANQSLTLEVRNLDSSPEEFDSWDLGIEKVIQPQKMGLITIPPLKAGTYCFEGEYHEKTAKGCLVAK